MVFKILDYSYAKICYTQMNGMYWDINCRMEWSLCYEWNETYTYQMYYILLTHRGVRLENCYLILSQQLLANTESKTELKSTERWCAKMSRSVTPYLLSYAVCPLRPRVMCVMTCMIVFFFKLTDAWVSILDSQFKIKT